MGETFARESRYSGVLMQQGRVQVDADWNEQIAIQRHRTETAAIDQIGPSGGPEDAAGLAISVQDDTRLVVGAGRYYVDGILCENEEAQFYDLQRDLPGVPDAVAALTERGAEIGLVYAHVWQRHVTAVEDPLLPDPALGGADTTTRLRTVCQVKVLPLPSVDVALPDDLEARLEEREVARAALATALAQGNES